MADREGFPYDLDWRKDAPVLMRLGVLPMVASLIAERRPIDADRLVETLHCRTIWSVWDFSNDGNKFLNVQYKYPSILFNENEVGHFTPEELGITDTEHIDVLKELADTRTTEIWLPFDSGDYVQAEPIAV